MFPVTARVIVRCAVRREGQGREGQAGDRREESGARADHSRNVIRALPGPARYAGVWSVGWLHEQ